MKKRCIPLIVLLLAITFNAQGANAQSQPQERGIAANAKPDAARKNLPPDARLTQITAIEHELALNIDKIIAQWALQDAPSIVEGLSLYKAAMLEVVDEVLKEGLRESLPESEIARFTSGLMITTSKPFQLLDTREEIDNVSLEIVENYMSRVVDSWATDGKTLNKQLWKMELQSRLEVAVNHRLDPSQKKQMAGEIDKLLNAVEKEVYVLLPSAPKQTVKSLNEQLRQRALGELDNDFSSEFKNIVTEQNWDKVLNEGREAARKRILQFPQSLEVQTEDVYVTSFISSASRLNYAPTKEVAVPTDFGKKWQKYFAKITEDNETTNRILLGSSIAVRQTFQDRENIAFLMSIGIDMLQ